MPPENNTNFQYYVDTPTISISGSQVTCKFSSLILGDTPSSSPPSSQSSLTETSIIDPGPTTEPSQLFATNSPIIDVYNRNPALPTPKFTSAILPASTLPNGLPDPSYSAKVSSINSIVGSFNSRAMSEASMMSLYGTITITSVDGDSVLTTITTDNYIAYRSSIDAAAASVNGTGTGDSTSGDGEDAPVVSSGTSTAWTVSVLFLLWVLVMFLGILLVNVRLSRWRRNDQEVATQVD
ncbi:hypothetical protein NHQ30_008318 [Ciborinia camelliae]|nr:hypothetical protein NHQ30_008318 [Ciborinia camelliae]